MICDSVTFSGFQSEKDLELNQINVFFYAESDFESLSVDSCILYICLPIKGSEGGASGAAALSRRVKRAGKLIFKIKKNLRSTNF